MTGRFHRALAGELLDVPPIWLMRQAGRYHSHYQRLRSVHSFEALCRTPALAAEVALGPVGAFDFDAAILFSDLLFPLDALGLGVSYDGGRPQVDGRLTFERLTAFRETDEALAHLAFQPEAVSATRARLPSDKGLIGFVGGPWTLFVYAVEGSHAGPLAVARDSGALYNAFAARIVPLLIESVRQQLEAGADVVMMFDTAAGALAPEVFRGDVARDVNAVVAAHPGRLGYYAKEFSDAHARAAGMERMPLAGVGLDPSRDLSAALRDPDRRGFIHGNFDPDGLLLTRSALTRRLDRFVAPLRALSAETRRGWMCGLGHGVLAATPEDNVRAFVECIRETFS